MGIDEGGASCDQGFKMKSLPCSAVLLAAAILFTGCHSTGTVDRFAKADTNKDGKLSANEASDYVVIGVFESLDVNKDGKLSLSECAVEAAPSTVKDFQKRDLNKDGVVTREEAIDYGRKHGLVTKAFVVADKNKDGYLTREEVKAYYGSREGSPN
jgi:Ca2+-binding EF-hand superfamily protein